MSLKLTALELAVQHWERLVRCAVNYDSDSVRWEGFTTSDCALCGVYAESQGQLAFCNGCPIADFTGKDRCVDTPYGLAADALCDLEDGYIDEDGIDHVRQMRNMLADLRDEQCKEEND